MIHCDVLNNSFNLYSVIILFEKNNIYMETKIHHLLRKYSKYFCRNLINFHEMIDIVYPTVVIKERFNFDFQYRSRIIT